MSPDDKPDELFYAQRRMADFYLGARNCRGKGNPDLLEAKMESARWWMRVVENHREPILARMNRPLAPGGFRLRPVEQYG